eukprot:14848-Pelagococcus_subviridis.AAC.5
MISGGGAASFHRYAATSIVVFSPSIAPLATFREALSFASRTSESEPPSLRITLRAPSAAAAIPTAPVPLPSSTTDASRTTSSFSRRNSMSTSDELHTLPPVPYPPDHPGASRVSPRSSDARAAIGGAPRRRRCLGRDTAGPSAAAADAARIGEWLASATGLASRIDFQIINRKRRRRHTIPLQHGDVEPTQY